jgi:GWxTD domain-containing protein
MYKIFIFIIFWISFSLAQIGQTSFIPLSVDYAIFRGAGEQIYLEIYIAFQEGQLQYSQTGENYQAEYLATTKISQNDTILFRKFDRRISKIDSIAHISSHRKFLNLFNFSLEPGQYSAQVSVKDLNSTRIGEYYFEFDAESFARQELDMSYIQLCSKITPDTSGGDFQKNSFHAIPNPECSYSISQPVLYYYAEIYNLDFTTEKEGHYSSRCTITDLEGELIKNYSEKTRQKPGTSAVIVGGHNIVTLPSNTYYLNLEIEDQQSQKIVRASKRFKFIKPTRKIIVSSDSAEIGTEVDYNIAEYLPYSEEQLNEEFDQLRYLTSKEQKSIFNNLDSDSKKLFLAKFWHNFDQTPETEINEFKTRYLQMVEFTNLNYGSMNKEGWKTDRGRIFLTYGIPDEIERNYMAIDMKPHEIWHYNELEGGILFIFADLTGFGEFDLLHSTYSRELYQPDWERLVRKTQGGTSLESGPN